MALTKREYLPIKKEVRITGNKKGEIFIKTDGAAGGLLFMGDLCRELFDLINQHKNFRIDVSYNPEVEKTRFEIIECDEDDRCQET